MEEEESSDGFEPKSPSAIDFYDYGDLSDDDDIEFTCDFSSANRDQDFPKLISSLEHLKRDKSLNSEEPVYAPANPLKSLVPNKPLASVLPEKYQNVDVKSMYNEYREDGSLRFLRIFGVAKKSNMPDIWRNVRKRKLEANSCLSLSGPLKECEVESDEETKFMQHEEHSVSGSTTESILDNKLLNNCWRFGPAKLWYDMAEVPETAETYDYGFKLRNSDEEQNNVGIDEIEDDAYLMVSQIHWEDDVIWDGDEVKDIVMKGVYNKKAAGWIPMGPDRTLSSFLKHCNYKPSRLNGISRIPQPINRIFRENVTEEKEIAQSIFPEENDKLLYDAWEKDVIWDSDAMKRILPPKSVEISDSNIILEIPEDNPSAEALEPAKDPKEKKFRPLKQLEEDAEELSLVNIKQDFYNISNDEYYNPKMTQETALKLNYGGTVLQHSIPAITLSKPFFPTHMNSINSRLFHRPHLRHYAHGPLSERGFHGVASLSEDIRQMDEERQRQREEFGGGDMFFMRSPEDLSGKDGELVLFEFSEEYPPLMMQVGMASKVRNYYRRTKQLPGSEDTLPNYKYGEVAFCHTSPFLGTLQPGESLQAYENNLFRAPIYEHKMEGTDFLVIRTRYGYFIREVETIYVVGQELPFIEVPAPKSEKANSFLRDFVSVYIYRLFWQSNDYPRKLKMDNMKKLFPFARDFGMRKRLHFCADFQRTGPNARCWLLKENFRLPTEEEIRGMVSPEQCCAYYSMLAGNQRLIDAGYSDKNPTGSEGENNSQNKVEGEFKATPWQTTQAFLSAMKGKCFLELTGVADPTGCGEGFSYVKASHKPQWSKEENGMLNPAKRIVKGTDADLRKLSLTGAKKLLKTNFNVSDKDVKAMSRWQVIDVVRTLSTEQAKAGEEGVTKYARGNWNSQAEYNRIYKEETQRIFDLQNRTLSSKEVLSSDEGSSSEEEDVPLEVLGKTLEDMLSNKKTAKDLSHEAEEAERRELKKMVSSDTSCIKNEVKPESDSPNLDGKILKIYRTFRDNYGKEFVRVETVRRTEVIQRYLSIKKTKDSEYIKRYVLDEADIEAKRKEKRRLQDQLRRLNKSQERGSKEQPPKKKRKVETPREVLKVKCGACGELGHMRTNRTCNLYQSSSLQPSIPVAMTEEQKEAAEMAGLNDVNLVQIDDTRVIISKEVVKRADEVRRKSLVIKIPKVAVTGLSHNNGKKKKSCDEPASDYLSTPKAVNRKRVDPHVSLSLILEKLVSELKSLPGTQPFWIPVNVKDAPNYHDIIEKPMDLSTMKNKARSQGYNSREAFLLDLYQIMDNSKKYNGEHSFLSLKANEMVQYCERKFEVDEEKLMDLEKAINPLLDKADIAFSYVLERIVSEHLKAVPESWPFHKPVDKRTAKGYYNIVKNPMDLDTLIKNCKAQKYKTRTAFSDDVKLIHLNCLKFNGSASHLTSIAKSIVDACEISFSAYDEQLKRLESEIEDLDKNNQVNNHVSPPKTIKHTVKIKLANHHHSSLNFNACLDNDSLVDVESMPEKSFNNGDSGRSDFDPLDFKIEESNSGLFPSIMESDFEQSGSASPISSKTQSLSFNGIHKHGSIGFENASKPYVGYTRDTTICDDLELSSSSSDSHSDQELETVMF